MMVVDGGTGSVVVVMAMQVKFVQIALKQSVLFLQGSPAGHGLHIGPPQSIPVSCPSLMPSEQVGAAVVLTGIVVVPIGTVRSVVEAVIVVVVGGAV